ncbi:MAG: CesT family type III secretion system chaperone, partial [Pseudomonadota bacterium]
SVGKSIRLNEQGISAFTYEDLTIVIEVPEAIPSFFVYTKLFAMPQSNNPKVLMTKLLQMNYLQQETRGGCIALDPMSDEVFFSYSDRVNEVNVTDFRNILENFIDTAINLVKTIQELESGKNSDSSSSGGQTASSSSEQDFMNSRFGFGGGHIIP